MTKNDKERIEALMELRKRHTDDDIIKYTAKLGCDVAQVKNDLKFLQHYKLTIFDNVIVKMNEWVATHRDYSDQEYYQALSEKINFVELLETVESCYDEYMNE